MKSPKMLFVVMAAIFTLFTAGCGDNVTVVQETKAQQPVETKSTFTVKDLKTQELQFMLDENGNLKDIRSGGIFLKPVDLLGIVYVSYRFGNVQTSPYKVALDQNLKATFTDLPNNDDGGRYYAVTTAGKKYLVEVANFTHAWADGVYSYVDSDSSVQWGELDEPSAQDDMFALFDSETQMASISIQFGCDTIFGTKQQATYVPGTKIVFEKNDGQKYQGVLEKDALGNLSGQVSNIPVTTASDDYYASYFAEGELYLLLPSGERVDFNFEYNTPGGEDSGFYVWYVSSWGGNFWVDSYSGNSLTLRYYPYY